MYKKEKMQYNTREKREEKGGNHEKMNKHQLKKVFNQKNETIVEQLYKNYNTILYGVAFSILKNKENSEDVVQIVLEKILVLPKEKLPTQAEGTWLYTVIKNEAIQYLRKQKKVVNIEEIYDLAQEDSTIEESIDKETYQSMICGLSQKEKEIVSLKILSDLTFREIAQLLNVPIATVQWRYYKSLKTLQGLLSNLSMFILGILVYVTRKTKKENIEIEQTNTTIENTNTNTENNKQESQDSRNNIQGEYEQVIVQETKMDVMDVGILSFSGVFLCMTIIFLIIFLKHQQNRNKKASK